MKKSSKAWKDYEDILIKMHNSGDNPKTIAQYLTDIGFSVSSNAVSGKLKRLGFDPHSNVKNIPPLKGDKSGNPFIEMLDKKEFSKLDPGQMFKKFLELRQFGDEFNPGQRTVSHKINTKGPIALVFSSDWHLGSPACDYERLERDLNIIKGNPQMFIGIGGDPYDGFMPYFRDAGAVQGQVARPQIQIDFFYKIVESLKGKVFGILKGNHEEMSSRKTGIDNNYFLLKNTRIPYLPNGGLLKIMVNKTEYNILWFHKWRYNSSLNEFNSHHRMRQILYNDADAVVQEHIHNPGMEIQSVEDFDRKRRIVNIRTGTYKIGDSYSQKFFKEGVPGSQAIVVYPDRKKMVVFEGADSLLDCETFLKGLKK